MNFFKRYELWRARRAGHKELAKYMDDFRKDIWAECLEFLEEGEFKTFEQAKALYDYTVSKREAEVYFRFERELFRFEREL